MFYMGIDQHKRHLTINVRDEQGHVVNRRQVSTAWTDLEGYFRDARDRYAAGGGYVAVLEVCGFNDYLVDFLESEGCRHCYLIKAPDRSRQKTDRRDAAKLSELLWINRDRIAAGDPVRGGIREIYRPTRQEKEARKLIAMRHDITKQRTAAKNKIKRVLRCYNAEQHCPVKNVFTKKGLAWLCTLVDGDKGASRLPLSGVDRMTLSMELANLERLTAHLQKTESMIDALASRMDRVQRVRTMVGGSYTALALVVHTGDISRFKRARSLCNFFGVTPGIRSSGQTKADPGSITKAGHPRIRYLLANLVLPAMRRDKGLKAWYLQIRRRRGSKVARVAVMRQLVCSLWHMLKHDQDYCVFHDRRKAA